MRAPATGVVRRAPALVGLALLAVLAAPGCKERTQRPLPTHVERTWVPLSATPLRGPASAKVTLAVFCDFQSPYCARTTERLQQIRQKYEDTVRIQYRYRPLPYYPQSQLAAEAAAAAAEQGQFWRYHDLLFSRQSALDRASLERYAQELGLDLERFKSAIESERARQQVDEDSILAASLGARGAPVVYVNGRPLRGTTDLARLEQFIEEELALADSLLDSGVEPRELYQRIARAPVASEPSQAPQEQPAAEPRPRTPRMLLDEKAAYKVEVGGSPTRGPQGAKVTLVLWSDFECRQCFEFESTLKALLAAYPKDIRVVWKNRPVPDHPDAMLAAEAALEANKQGKFWPMHDLLFSSPGLDRARLEEYATRLGLDMESFRTALEERTWSEQVTADLDLSERLVIANLPTVFLNGRPLSRDALSLESLKARVKEELGRADQLLKQGVSAERLYESMIANGLEGLPAPDLSTLPPLPKGTYTVDLGSAPVRGPKDAPITLITFSDFQCPYCARLEKTIAQLQAQYGERLRIVWKDAPNVEFHKEAMGAHEAARAAAEQGRFWEMHDKIFSRPYVLNRAAYERYARELGLDMERFRKALDEGRFRAAIEEETAYGISLAGPSGTPTVYLNGRLIPGAYPLEVFRQLIDEELARPAESKPGAPSASQSL